MALRLGHYQELVPQLLEMTAQHPLQERFDAQLMLALARTGLWWRPCMHTRRYAGLAPSKPAIEPGPELRDIHRQILAGDAAQMTSEADGIQPGEAPVTTANRALTGLTGVAADRSRAGPSRSSRGTSRPRWRISPGGRLSWPS